MASGCISDDSIEPTTPPRTSHSAKVICLDSSPNVASPCQNRQASPPSMAEHNFRSAMSAGPGASMGRTNFGHRASSSYLSNGLHPPNPKPPASGIDSLPSSSFRSTLEKFKYGAPQTKNSAASDKSSDLSDLESSPEEEPQPKKRRLVRGGSTASRQNSELEQSNDDRSDPVKEVPASLPHKPSTPTANDTQAVPQSPTISDVELREKARRILKLNPLIESKRIIAALRQTKGNVQETLRLLTPRSNTVPTTTLSIKSHPNGLYKSTTAPPSRLSPSPSLLSANEVRVKEESKPLPAPPRPSTLAAEFSSDEDASDDEQHRADKEERAAVKWFNSADVGALMDTTNCSAAQAETIISLRPFTDANHIEANLGSKAAKGVTPRLFHQCKDLMAGYYQVDEVLEKCEKIGRELSEAMSSWLPDASAAPSRLASSSLHTSAVTSREGTPASTLNLSSLKKGASLADKHYIEEQPKLLANGVVLKHYQLVGVNWLHLLYRKKTSCILADEMGLGKTAQVIAFFAHLKETGIRGPHLVVAPSSVLENWDREFRFFAPDINVRKYYGSMKDRIELREELSADQDIEVILTTYDMAAGAPQDHSFLRKFGKRGCGLSQDHSDCQATNCRRGGFDICVFDEGHMLKNRKSQKYDKLLRLRANWRLLLTGTPLQNNLQELISLLNFIMPNYFSDAEEALAAIFKVKAGGQQNPLSKQRVDRAKRMMHPFVLRRLKDKVLTDLGTKMIREEYCDMTPVQRKIYLQAVARTKRAVANAEQEAMTVRTRGKATNSATRESGHVLMELRKAANHPLLTRRLFDEAKIDAMARDLMKEPDYANYSFEHVKEDLRINTDAQLSFSANTYPATRKHVLPAKEWMNSGKIHALERLIPEIQAKGDRILIFSQFTMVLDILCVCLENMGVKYVGFTGSTQVEDRQHLVDQFTHNPSITVFLLSTKAGGLGINLVAANWVIFFDHDFNPHNDKQAADRCYRMGQTKPVTIIKLLSRGTIDEDIHALGEKKLELADRVSGEDEIESDEAEQKKTAQTLLARLRDAAVPDLQEISDGE